MHYTDRIDMGYGLCRCGCGRKTAVPKKSNAPRGIVKGVPSPYVRGHNMRTPGPDYVIDDNGCWVWARHVNRDGYGSAWCTVTRSSKRAHRLFYEHMVGPIPAGMHLDHKCQNKRCVNPDHLEVITPLENTRRSRHAKLTIEDVRVIRASTESGVQLARRFGISKTVISGIRTGRTWVEPSAESRAFLALNGFAL